MLFQIDYYCQQFYQSIYLFSILRHITIIRVYWRFSLFCCGPSESNQSDCCVTMLKGEVNEISTENFDTIHLKLDQQFSIDDSPPTNSNKKREWNVKSSKFALNTTNPIRAIVEHLNVQPNPDKAFIPLSVGKWSKWWQIQFIKFWEKHNFHSSAMKDLKKMYAWYYDFTLFYSYLPLEDIFQFFHRLQRVSLNVKINI